MKLNKYIIDLVSLFYPRLCVCCSSALHDPKQILCTQCMSTLPETGYHTTNRNPVSDIFIGRLKLESATSLLFHEKGSKYSKLLYGLKYKGNKDSGIFLGKLIGSRLKEVKKQFDCIIPVPLHKRKFRKRGFNQSTVIAQGISEILKIPVYTTVLQRTVYNPTQTRKGRYDRWQNVEGIFRCTDNSFITNKHILLVDDVVTTGATLEAAGSTLLQAEGLKLSIATAAYANL